MRKIPATLVTQHPDHASKPYWLDQEYIANNHEIEECYLSFKDFEATEYKWDWEGKFVDESVIEKLYAEHLEYFIKHQLGRDKFLTFRLPNPKVEVEYRIGRALMGIHAAKGLAEKAGMEATPLFEVILPMTETAEEMIDIQDAYQEIASLSHKYFTNVQSPLKHLEIIPLFEQADIIANSDQILQRYLDLCKWRYGFYPEYMRPYIARSDPALNAGIVPTVLGIKIALSGFAQLAVKTGIPMYPMIGAAALPFRGGINPETVEAFVNEYQGIRTTTIQSAFRYDYSFEEAKAAIAKLEEILPDSQAELITAEEKLKIQKVMSAFERIYQHAIIGIAPLVNEAAKFIPNRRERVQHTGLFGYSREVGETKLPRAIKFTAALYSLGIPPEFIATGRGLANIENQKIVFKYFKNFRADLIRAGKYLNKTNLQKLAQKEKAWQGIYDDVVALEKILELEFKPETEAELEHQQLTSEFFKAMTTSSKADLEKIVVRAGVLRKSLG
ncbi:MAG: phosphoenolpyruvate carboxylase [bacterium]